MQPSIEIFMQDDPDYVIFLHEDGRVELGLDGYNYDPDPEPIDAPCKVCETTTAHLIFVDTSRAWPGRRIWTCDECLTAGERS